MNKQWELCKQRYQVAARLIQCARLSPDNLLSLFEDLHINWWLVSEHKLSNPTKLWKQYCFILVWCIINKLISLEYSDLRHINNQSTFWEFAQKNFTLERHQLFEFWWPPINWITFSITATTEGWGYTKLTIPSSFVIWFFRIGVRVN